ncbi:prolipoprotein diacylglyceryl transferase [Nakamurella sp. YIM 132087]|uniref:Phosphatidylglycerol--prolipoprotein diacylglyceryl transferase n=1 Tax=Nakamurella alba TaxID=2665158 RepID=A0A7K1FRH2_9ACTN|nr:prolipoprotein diacylglyceryl transferase [Nakamurella alba]
MAGTATAYLADIPSPAQGVWYVGPLPLRAYAVCIIVGIVVAVWWGNKRWVARGGRAGRVTDIAVFAVPFGLVGGRLYHVITDNELYFREGRNPWKAFAIWDGGLGIWGAIALGGVGAWIGCRYYKVSFAAFADSIAPGIVVAQAIGRLGNYFNQELFGAQTSVPWALEVFLRTPGGAAGTQEACGIAGSTPEFPTDYIKATPEILCGTYHPTFLYELLWNLAVAALLVWADRRFRLGAGRVFWLYVAGYTAGRGWIEMLRIDTANTFLGLRINVFTSIVMFVVAIGFLIALRGRHREDPALLRGRGDEDPDDDKPADEEQKNGGDKAVVGATPASTSATSSPAVDAGGAAGAVALSKDDPRSADDGGSTSSTTTGQKSSAETDTSTDSSSDSTGGDSGTDSTGGSSDGGGGGGGD